MCQKSHIMVADGLIRVNQYLFRSLLKDFIKGVRLMGLKIGLIDKSFDNEFLFIQNFFYVFATHYFEILKFILITAESIRLNLCYHMISSEFENWYYRLYLSASTVRQYLILDYFQKKLFTEKFLFIFKSENEQNK